MGKIKVKKQNTFIDMTAMSDVTVLLLTFFMMTSTFLAKEPIQVTTPSSVSEFTIPETNKLTMLVDPSGKIFMTIDNQRNMGETLKRVGQDYGISFTDIEVDKFKQLAAFGVPIADMKAFLALSMEEQDKYLKENMGTDRAGIPTKGKEILNETTGETTVDNEFKHWIRHAAAVNEELNLGDLLLAIKADQTTPYPVIQTVLDNLRELRKNRYLLITSLKTASNQ
ncbi:biopolymer transporter ExbD [Bacteroidales bacterium OttesenSCG-928-M11]|nr:biopolymer transporter ExbD [Bacteroidales bacterium OttesenSCG-928-M11]